jgi:ABC-2 type transport system permease protein
MTTIGYLHAELLRAFRNRRLLCVTLGLPLVFYALVAVPDRGVEDFAGTGIPWVVYSMVGFASMGAMMTAVSAGTRIAAERTIGWTQQLRITPLPGGAYVRAKIVTAYAMALACMLSVFALATIIGASLTVVQWLAMTGLMLVGLLPFAALGIVVGHTLNVDAVGPACAGLVTLLTFVSGTWVPVAADGFLHTLATCLPSYWIGQASRVVVDGHAWSATGWLVVATWTLVLTALARWAYRRDLERD